MSSCASFQVQVASIMEILAKTAVVEITKLVDDGSAALRLEMCRSQRENEALKTKLLLMEGELRAVRGYGEGTPDNSLNLSFEVQVCDKFRETQRRTSGAAAANGGEGPLCKEEELHMQPCPAGDPEKGLQAELKQEPEEQPLTPTLPLLESVDWGMELQPVWSEANNLEIAQEKNGQCGGSSEHGDARLDDFSPPYYRASQRPRSEKDERSASQLELKQNGRPLTEKCIVRPADDVLAEMAFPLGSPGECDGSSPCEASSDTSAEAKSPCRTERQEEQLICTRCGKTFPGALELKTHEEQHSVRKRFSCSECGKGFTSSSALEKHKQVHTREKPFTCEQCGKCFSLKSNLKTHQVTHTGEKCFSCTVCNKSFTYLSVLKQHQKVHTGEKTHSCNECGKSFARPDHLKIHQWVHTGEKPHSCKKCGKRFTQLSNLKTHQRVHTKEKPFTCEQCGMCFSMKCNLKTHQITHTREKSFSCTVCNKSFTKLRSLKNHQRVHTGVKNVQLHTVEQRLLPESHSSETFS